MNEHYLDLAITSASGRASTIIAAFAGELLSHGNNCRVIFDALEADPECALAQAYAGALFLTQMTREGHVQATPRIEAARALSSGTSERERQTIAAISAWAAGDIASAIRHFREIVQIWPHDLVAAKFCQVLELGYGDIPGMLRTSGMAAAVEGRDALALGLHAFALDQNDAPEIALRFARRAIDGAHGCDPWAQHAAAHALAAMDEPIEARNLLRAHAATWDRCSSFMLTHNWWHLALLSLELGDSHGALQLFDNHVWGVRKGHCQDQVNAIALLARLDMAGLDTGERWSDVAIHVAPQAADGISTFLDLHYLYALAQAGHSGLADAVAERLGCGVDEDPLAGLGWGIVAHARGDYRTAALGIGPALPHLSRIGGSNIQRALFADMFGDSVRRMSAPAAAWKQAA